jgi:hypothetical protein
MLRGRSEDVVLEGGFMGKPRGSKRDEKKKAQKTAKEKRKDKKAKRLQQRHGAED